MIDKKIIIELESAEAEIQRIDASLSSKDIDSKDIRDLSKKRNEISGVVELYKEYKNILKSISENEELLNEPDFKELANEEISELKLNLVKVVEKIKDETKPVDPLDKKDVILEIRAGAGGDEAALFASDLLRMYCLLYTSDAADE